MKQFPVKKQNSLKVRYTGDKNMAKNENSNCDIEE
jgi:hypothetical protein